MSAQSVGILGGMGPAAGADFVRLFVQACARWRSDRGLSVDDQSFPPHWLLQVPVPDRTGALLEGGPSPLPTMADALRRLADAGAGVVAIACNTAHRWHGDLQAQCPRVALLHIVEETVRSLQASGAHRVGCWPRSARTA